jgi:hypothetical protein
LKPNDTEKKDLLVQSLSEILWKAGGESKCACVALNSQSNCFDLEKNARSSSHYVADGITEKVFKKNNQSY